MPSSTKRKHELLERGVAVKNTTQEIENFKEALDSMSVSIQEATLIPETEEVVQVVSCYIAKKLTEKTKCRQCINSLCGSKAEKICTLTFYRVGAQNTQGLYWFWFCYSRPHRRFAATVLLQ